MNFKLLVLFVLMQAKVFCQNSPIAAPAFEDEYSKVVFMLEQGKTDIDYKVFRESVLKSNQYNVIIKGKRIMDSLSYFIFKADDEADYDTVINVANSILSIDYTNITVHRMLYQAYKSKGDSLNAKKHATIQTGLLNSILKHGNGNSCATAWPVVQVTEEGYILKMLGGEIIDMGIDTDNLCDTFTLNLNGIKKDYFFRRVDKKVQ
jgi:hypothetical protein